MTTGFTQTYDLDYTKTFSVATKLNFVQLIKSMAVNLKCPLHQLDIKMSFFMAIWMKQCLWFSHQGLSPIGSMFANSRSLFMDSNNLFVHSLKSSAKKWYHMTWPEIKLIIQCFSNSIAILIVQLDNIIITGSDQKGIKTLIHHLRP